MEAPDSESSVIRNPRGSHIKSSSTKHSKQKSENRISRAPPRDRLRHDDSQVHFEAIESSPFASEDIESQMLTEHQKETRARQNVEAAMFPEFSSSPQRSAHESDHQLPRFLLTSNPKREIPAELDDPDSPDLPVIDGEMEVFLGSSPTPRSSKEATSDPPFMEAPPSSPPSAGGACIKDAPSEALQDSKYAPEKEALQGQAIQQNRELSGQVSPTTWSNNGIADCEGSIGNLRIQALAPKAQQDRAPTAVDVAKDTEMPLPSDCDVIVDAPTEPTRQHSPSRAEPDVDQVVAVVQSSPRVQTSLQPMRCDPQKPSAPSNITSAELAIEDEGSVSGVMDSFLSQNSQYSTDDEQIAAQLAVDMERASSQAEKMMADDGEAAASKGKRKRRASTSSLSTQKSRRIAKAQSFQVVIDGQKPKATEESGIASGRRRETAEIAVAPASVSEGDQSAMVGTTCNHPTIMEGRRLRSEAPESQWKRREHGEGSTQSIPRRSARLSRDMEPGSGDDARQAGHEEDAISDPRAADKERTGSSVQHDEPSLSPSKWNYHRLMGGFRHLLDNIRHVTLGREEEREITNVLFESVKEIHEAGRRREQH